VEGGMTKQDDNPVPGLGPAAYAMMIGMITNMVETGRRDEALAILENARNWLDQGTFQHSTPLRSARKVLQQYEEKIRLLAAEAGSDKTN
jgi:hypothetical protein